MHPGEPDVSVTVPGFSNERLYVHPKHPSLCSPGDIECAVTSYVLTGDELLATKECQGWVFVSFKGSKKTTTGWVPTRRLPEHYADGFGQPARAHIDIAGGGAAREPTLSANPACAEAQATLNQGLKDPEHFAYGQLASAAENPVEPAELPGGRNKQFGFWSITLGDARIRGHAVKVLSYESGGTCHDGSVELWTSDLKTRIPVKGSNADTIGSEENPDNEDAGYTGEGLVRLAGAPYFEHIGRSAHKIRLFGFRADLSVYPACELVLVAPPRERVRRAPEPTVCNALLDGKVSGAPMVDIEPFPLSKEALTADAKGDFLPGGGPFRMIATGRIDIDNHGQPDEVGIVEFAEDSGAGCGHEYRAWWPVKLNTDGMPAAGSAFNQQAAKVAGTDNDSRVFTFRGATYFENRSRPEADGVPTHEVWKFTPAGAVQACVFEAAQYDAVDIAKKP
jgi:hypothetical protein